MKKRNNILTISAAGLMSILVLSCQKDELVAPLQVTNTDNNAVVRTTDEAQVLDRATPYTLTGNENTWDKAYQSEDGILTSRTIPRLLGKWKLTSLNGRPIHVRYTDTPFIHINDVLTGFGGCNRISGSVLLNGDNIYFRNIRATRMYCPAVHQMEERFLNALRSTISFTLNVDQLRLSNDRGEVAILERYSDQSPTTIVTLDR